MARFVVGVSGASGVILAKRLLEELRRGGHEIHLIPTAAALRTLTLEHPEVTVPAFKALADVVHDARDIAAAPSSGTFRHDGMAIVPCSMATVSAVAYGFAKDLLVRSADVTLKERRRLVLVPRETPLHAGHLEAMRRAAELGACVLPPMLSFYHRPRSIDDLVAIVVGKVLDQLGVEHALFRRWEGPPAEPK